MAKIGLLSTLPELLGVDRLEMRRPMSGQSLVPALQGQGAVRNCSVETDCREDTFKRAIIRPDGWKLILALETGQRELYDLTRDPHEQHDLSATQPARVQSLESELRAHYRALGCDFSLRRGTPGLNPVYPSQGRSRK